MNYSTNEVQVSYKFWERVHAHHSPCTVHAQFGYQRQATFMHYTNFLTFHWLGPFSLTFH